MVALINHLLTYLLTYLHTANDLVILAVGKCCQSESETGFTVEKSLWLGFVGLFMYCFISSIG